MELKTLDEMDIRVWGDERCSVTMKRVCGIKDDEYFKYRVRKEALKWLKSAKDEINIADWVEFFGLEKEYSDMCAEAVNG